MVKDYVIKQGHHYLMDHQEWNESLKAARRFGLKEAKLKVKEDFLSPNKWEILNATTNRVVFSWECMKGTESGHSMDLVSNCNQKTESIQQQYGVPDWVAALPWASLEHEITVTVKRKQ